MAARPTRKRTALLLYGILLVLPTVVLGGLHWHQLWLDHQLALDNLPAEARAASERLADMVRRRLDETLRLEAARPFDHFAPLVLRERGGEASADNTELVATPLAEAAPPPGVLGWFSADLDPFLPDGRTPTKPHGEAAYVRPAPGMPADQFFARAAAVVLHNVEIGFFARVARLSNIRTEPATWLRLGAFLSQFDPHTGAPRPATDCLGRNAPALAALSEPVVTTDFYLEVILAPDGTPIASATRRVLPEEVPKRRRDFGECGREVYRDFSLLQGVLLDLDWLVEVLPREHTGILRPDERYVPAGQRPPAGADIEPIDLLARLGFDAPAGVLGDRGRLVVAMDRAQLERTFRGQMLRFLGVAAMLVLSLATGLGLLLFSVNRELDRAERTRNFVAAVTHELRTPLSTIALHAEMLLEGWAQTEERRHEYYQRISRETQRLSTLVERVLEKSRLSEANHAGEVHSTGLETGDLSAAVRAVKPMLASTEARQAEDVVFELAEGLPPVQLNQEAINSIVVNLVENARKYAPVARGGEPILVRTRAEGEGACLEVLDRGPGIPADLRERVFEAFYRMGNEATRTSQGTGLGLHLVDLQARALGGSARVTDRPGGGAVFQVVLPPSA